MGLTDSQTRQFRDFWAAQMPVKGISLKLNITRAAVVKHATILNLPEREIDQELLEKKRRKPHVVNVDFNAATEINVRSVEEPEEIEQTQGPASETHERVTETLGNESPADPEIDDIIEPDISFNPLRTENIIKEPKEEPPVHIISDTVIEPAFTAATQNEVAQPASQGKAQEFLVWQKRKRELAERKKAAEVERLCEIRENQAPDVQALLCRPHELDNETLRLIGQKILRIMHPDTYGVFERRITDQDIASIKTYLSQAYASLEEVNQNPALRHKPRFLKAYGDMLNINGLITQALSGVRHKKDVPSN